MRKIVLFASIAIFYGCSKFEYDNSELNNSEFQSYVDSFLNEAKIRNFDLTASNINFYLADIENEDVGGICRQRREEIIIDRENWEIADEASKERLVFHELGHCILGRLHRNESTKNGDCISFMNGNENGFSCSKNLESTLWRTYYLDELFNKNTILPNWYTDNQEYATPNANRLDIVSIVDLNTNFYSTSLDLNDKEKYVIEFTFKDWAIAAGDAANVRIRFEFGDFFYNCFPSFEGGSLVIGGENPNLFFRKKEYFKKDIKLTVRRNSNLFQFFLDEQFLHAMEVKQFENNVVAASMDGPINMDINIFEFE